MRPVAVTHGMGEIVYLGFAGKLILGHNLDPGRSIDTLNMRIDLLLLLLLLSWQPKLVTW